MKFGRLRILRSGCPSPSHGCSSTGPTCPICSKFVTLEWSVLLDLSRGAATKTFGSLVTKLLLQVPSESAGAMAIGMIRSDEGVGDIPGVQGVQGSL